jgi:hypothetical protein
MDDCERVGPKEAQAGESGSWLSWPRPRLRPGRGGVRLCMAGPEDEHTTGLLHGRKCKANLMGLMLGRCRERKEVPLGQACWAVRCHCLLGHTAAVPLDCGSMRMEAFGPEQ